MLMSNLLNACWHVLSEFGLNATMTTSYVPADVKSFAGTSIPIGGVQTWAVPQDVGRRKLRHSGISSWIDTVGLAHAYRIRTSSWFPHLPQNVAVCCGERKLKKTNESIHGTTILKSLRSFLACTWWSAVNEAMGLASFMQNEISSLCFWWVKELPQADLKGIPP